jgi:RNA-directed DNA polymerase
MSLIAGDTPRPLQPPVAQRDIETEVIYCVGGVMSPLIFNVAMSVLDEHLHQPWKPGGIMETSGQRARRRARGLPNWRVCRYADDFVVLVHGAQADAGTLRDEIAAVLAPLGLRLSPDKTRIVRVPRAQEGEAGM